MRQPARSVQSVLFTDIVGSTEIAAELGDRKWARLLDRHDALVRKHLRGYGGREVNTTGDGFVATFDAPTQAVRCAKAIVDGADALGVELRAGLHVGEVEARGDDVGGIGVHVAARIAALAGPHEVLVSNTVKEVCAGSDLAFEARGSHALRGVPGRRQLFALADPTVPPRTPGRRRPPARSAPARKAARPAGIRVVLADDHPLWRETLRGLLEARHVATVVAEVGNGRDAVAAVAEHQPDVVLLDIDMPEMSGIEAARAITQEQADARVLILSSLKERDEVLAAVRAGASGYLLKTAGPSDIADAITRISAGEVVFPPELSSVVLTALRDPRPVSGLGALTEREEAVLALMAEGRSNQAISSSLHLSAKTIEGHIATIFVKLELEATPDDHRRVQAVVAYLKSQRARSSG